jgi:hypothetical protein
MDSHTKNGMSRAERIRHITKRDGPNCFFPGCGAPFDSEEDITFDHWIPQSKGGTWHVDNLRLMHKRCNALKGDRMPNADGTLPPLPKELLGRFHIRADKSGRVDYCETCASGRMLINDEICELCGSEAQPKAAPKYLQKDPKECDHSTYHCWMCFVHDPSLRKPAYEEAFGVEP